MTKKKRKTDTEAIERAKILLVDDRPDKLLGLEALLADMDADLVKATSGRDALRILLRDNFALILLDVSMPGMDGFETAALIRQRPLTEHTPIIFITSINTNETHVSQGYSLGAVDYIFTPVIPEVLRAKVSVFVDLYQKNMIVRRQSELLADEATRRAHSIEARQRELLNRLNVGVFRANEKGAVIEANPAFLRIFEIGALSELKKEDAERVCGDLRESLREGLEQGAVDLELGDENGGRRWISVTRTASRNEGQLFIDGLVEDITVRKIDEAALKDLNETLERRVEERTEEIRVYQEQLSRAERLASLGTLAAGIAHEINNPLNSILLASEYALKKNKLEVSQDTLKAVMDETRRCGKIIRGVLQFARNERTTKTASDLNSVITHACEIARTYVSAPMRLKLDLASMPLMVVLSTTEMEQVIINLIQNAAEAASKDPEIHISSRREGQNAYVYVRDFGPGIDSSLLGKIFDPFFSTRNGRGGTGLGLSVVHGIVSAHGGTIRAESEPDKGALFVISLPIARERDRVSGEETSAEDDVLLAQGAP